MVFTKRLREGIRRGRIRCSVRIWMRPHVKVGGRYQMDDGHIVVDSITPIKLRDITRDLARESGFDTVKDLLEVARHGKGTRRTWFASTFCRRVPGRHSPVPASTGSIGPGGGSSDRLADESGPKGPHYVRRTDEEPTRG